MTHETEVWRSNLDAYLYGFACSCGASGTALSEGSARAMAAAHEDAEEGSR